MKMHPISIFQDFAVPSRLEHSSAEKTNDIAKIDNFIVLFSLEFWYVWEKNNIVFTFKFLSAINLKQIFSFIKYLSNLREKG